MTLNKEEFEMEDELVTVENLDYFVQWIEKESKERTIRIKVKDNFELNKT